MAQLLGMGLLLISPKHADFQFGSVRDDAASRAIAALTDLDKYFPSWTPQIAEEFFAAIGPERRAAYGQKISLGDRWSKILHRINRYFFIGLRVEAIDRDRCRKRSCVRQFRYTTWPGVQSARR